MKEKYRNSSLSKRVVFGLCSRPTVAFTPPDLKTSFTYSPVRVGWGKRGFITESVQTSEFIGKDTASGREILRQLGNRNSPDAFLTMLIFFGIVS